ncbi:ThuA domain-containing protein [Emticicia sp. CRIBPO]|uniref:ThuA domain-containing protein n=1 Tax=Emticicia sp. CRIBPO TaxID=2683258 RepID=UPI001411FB4B|nr:ThuA domain-containing protein [Emticicia sp. CRIBPO]NBA87032.1 ThuA domain-containing protein [Emticicia sp. CRIBPO]
MKSNIRKSLFFCLALLLSFSAMAQAPIKVLLIDGQNNHGNWPETTIMMKKYLEETGLFKVTVATTPPKGGNMATFKPVFSNYDAVVSNYNGEPWPVETQKAFEKFVQNGGGFVSVHAADNAFPQWKAYNQMIGIGGWEGRDEKSGPYLYYNEQNGEFVKDTSPGRGGSHGDQHQFLVKARDPNHPITKGLPESWMHENDELYDRLRGPGALTLEVLATSYSQTEKRGSGRHEPVLMVTKYGKGRIFHTTLGHGNDSQKCVGFITTLQRGTEWVAKGEVTQKVPEDFPNAEKASIRP